MIRQGFGTGSGHGSRSVPASRWRARPLKNRRRRAGDLTPPSGIILDMARSDLNDRAGAAPGANQEALACETSYRRVKDFRQL